METRLEPRNRMELERKHRRNYKRMMIANLKEKSADPDRVYKQVFRNQHCPSRMSMIKELEKLRIGLTKPTEFIHYESSRRSQSLHLNKFRDMERKHQSPVNTLDVDPAEHRYLLSGSQSGRIIIHDMITTSEKRPREVKVLQIIDRENTSAHNYSVEKVQWYPHDSGMFVTSGMDKHIKVWDSNTMTIALDVKVKEKIYCHEMSKLPCVNCLVAVASSEEKVKIVDLKSGSKAHELLGHSSGVLTCCWSPRDGALLATAGRDNRILLWDIRSAKACLKSLDQHNGRGNSSAESSVAAHDGFVNGLHFTSDGFSLISFGCDNRLRVWDMMSGKNKRVNFGTVINDSQRNVQITMANLNSGSDMVYVPSGKEVLGFKLTTGECLSELKGHFYNVYCCIFEPWFHELYSSGKDYHIIMWSPYDLHELDLSNTTYIPWRTDDWSASSSDSDS